MSPNNKGHVLDERERRTCVQYTPTYHDALIHHWWCLGNRNLSETGVFQTFNSYIVWHIVHIIFSFVQIAL